MQDDHKAQVHQHAQQVLLLIQSLQSLQGKEADLHAWQRDILSQVEQERVALRATYQSLHAVSDPDSQRELDALQGPLSKAVESLHTALGASLASVGLKHAQPDTMAAYVQQVLGKTAPVEQAAQS